MTYRYVNSALDYRVVNLAGDYRLVDDVSRLPPDYPTDPAPIAATITSFSPSYVSVTNSLKRQVRTRGVQAWQLRLYYGAMTRADFAPLWSFLVSRAGQVADFTVSVPGLNVPRGTAVGTPIVNGSGQSGNTLISDGWAAGAAVLKKGDWIEIEGDRKVYQITADVTSDGSGNAYLPIYPALRRSPGDNTTIHTDVVFTCALASDLLSADFDQCLHARGFEVELVEVLS